MFSCNFNSDQRHFSAFTLAISFWGEFSSFRVNFTLEIDIYGDIYAGEQVKERFFFTESITVVYLGGFYTVSITFFLDIFTMSCGDKVLAIRG